MQTGGPVQQTGLYMLHRGEYVVPANQTHVGPVFISFSKEPSRLGMNGWLDSIGDRILEDMRR